MFHPEALSVVRAMSGQKAATASVNFLFGGNLGFAAIARRLAYARLGHACGNLDDGAYRGGAWLFGCQCGCDPQACRCPVCRPCAARCAATKPKPGTDPIAAHPDHRADNRAQRYKDLYSALLRRIRPAFRRLDRADADHHFADGLVGTLFGVGVAERIGRKMVIILASLFVLGTFFAVFRTDGWLRLLMWR